MQINIHRRFIAKCRAASADDQKAMHYINILLSSVEYETFVKLMRIMRPVAVARLSLLEKADAKTVSDIDGGGKTVSPAKAGSSSKAADTGDSKTADYGYNPSDAKGGTSNNYDDGKLTSGSK